MMQLHETDHYGMQCDSSLEGSLQELDQVDSWQMTNLGSWWVFKYSLKQHPAEGR